MKKFFYFLMAAAAMTLYACNNDDEKSKINTVTINVLIDNEKVSDAVDVTLTSKSSSTSYVATTTGGVATFSVAAGVYSNYRKDGELTYTDYLPCWNAVWWFQSGTQVKIPAYSQIVIAIKGAIDNTATYSNSVDLSNADYAMYDPEVFTLAAAYPAPSSKIPSSHYLKTYLYGMGTAWALSNISPAFVVFSPEGMTAEAFVKTASNIETTGTKAFSCAKVPVSWVMDGVEVYNATALDKSNKRLLGSVDAGYVKFTNKLGYTVYRNVNKEATEALQENSGKLVYNYAGGTADVENGSTDPSGIDAEASIAKGAHIIFKDTNNSTNDFHQRKVASIKK